MKILPGIYQFAMDQVTVSNLKEVSIEDLLGREPIRFDMQAVKQFISGKTILVTGGGGSIGSELCRQIAAHSPKRLIIFDIYENNAYDIQQELIRIHPDLKLTVLIGSVRDKKRLKEVFEKYRPEIVYHAAAHKHVPLMEESPAEAIKNNCGGTYNTAIAALSHGCRRFVLISTDKAVNPTNIMGASKRICEMIIQSFDEKIKAGKADEIPQLFTHEMGTYYSALSKEQLQTIHTEFVAVRFGNVLGSNGSVIPLFRRQIAAGGPVTLTDLRIIRYFMTIREAVQLVLTSGAFARDGELFVLDMGRPVKILDLAESMIRLSGFEPYKDIDIVETGLRPGEKLYEELLVNRDEMTKTSNEKIFIEKEESIPSREEISAALAKLEAACDTCDDAVVRKTLQEIVPSFRPSKQ
jgi:FlaA1/EpsC-like NDP-sugar epimerase